MVFGSLLILSSRKWSIVTSLNDIPKMYVPINQIDLHKPVHKLVHGELNRVNDILAERKPLSEDMTELGWGPLDGEFDLLKLSIGIYQLEHELTHLHSIIIHSDPIHYKSAVIQTSGLLEEAAARLSPYFIRQPHMTFRRYLEYLVSIQVIEREEIARYYIDRYEYARFCDAELSTAEYKEAMKLFALLLRELKFPVNYH